MTTNSLESIISEISLMEMADLRVVEGALRVAMLMRSQATLSTDKQVPQTAAQREEEGPGLNDVATQILEDVDGVELTLADQALLASLILSDGYQQDVFSSRDVNDIIAECGRPRVVHITSAIAGLLSRSFLTGTSKALSLSKEGKAKARGLIGMVKRREAA